ncbi:MULTISPECIES: tripartite tricarboxylate transporter substrate binding protein [unclassified Bordetella]|uniref:tripartite tricarboxylate transporter substrate binding protein n=1 Tax=unclassified Bordetella TaxID=2630031 RepID=UPI00132212F9|nr:MULTISPECIES: tripartite tricarboxylate transporter substrate binding protein [unclassified Bordetella]MVW73335.1 tripartite tricarboxylate transporter substrate binding protein [Bordetella sp. 15P40C-2]MVW78352.1 tripartite tricarboxylate transporter substrate binding protein [Bordetella sp. 02P26C-1]
MNKRSYFFRGILLVVVSVVLGLIVVFSHTGHVSASANSSSTTTAFPTRPLTIIVTFPPGGGTDLLARKLGALIQQRLGQPVVVENRPGASGNIGARAVAEAPADGHTLLMVNSSFAINPGVYGHLGFDPKKDFQAVINVAFVPSVLIVPEASRYHSLADWIQAGQQPGAHLATASCGNGTPQHLAIEMLMLRADVPVQHVPYRGCGPALTDVLTGQVPAGVVTASSAAPFLAAGKVRALAVTSPQRSTLMADVPTVAEQGLPGYELDQWHGLLVPAGTPAEVVAKLNRTVAQIMKQPDVRRDLLKIGFSPTTSTAAEFQSLIGQDIDRFAALTQRIGLKAD